MGGEESPMVSWVLHSSVVAKEKTNIKQNPVHVVNFRTARATGWELVLKT